MVNRVEGLEAQLQLLPLGDVEDLAQAEVQVDQSRSDQHINAGVAERVRLRVLECVQVEPVIDRPLAPRDIAVADAVGQGETLVPVLEES